jgi:holin-like protein
MHLRRNLRIVHGLLRRYILLQFGLLVAVWWICELAARHFRLPLPGAILGIFMLLALLFSGVVPVSCVSRGVKLLLAELMLLYVPPMLALREHSELLSLTGLELVGIVLFGTLLVMCGTALVVERIVSRSEAVLKRGEVNAA